MPTNMRALPSFRVFPSAHSPRLFNALVQALACGTPVVTAGALQSVHRLAEGMIAAAAAAKWHDRNGHNPEATVVLEAAAEAMACRRGGAPGVAGRGVGQQTAGGVGVAEPENNDAGHHPTGRADGTSTQGADRASCTVASPHCDANTDGNDVDANSLVETLVATTTTEYVRKAVAVAAPGALRESVRRALCRGRDGMLHGDGDSVAMDWERFLKRAARSA